MSSTSFLEGAKEVAPSFATRDITKRTDSLTSFVVTLALTRAWTYQEFPGEVIGLSFPPSAKSSFVIIYSKSYTRSFNGFVVKLSSEEMLQVAGILAMNGVVSVFLNAKKQLHTTRTWEFMGFPQQTDKTNTGSDVIISVLDSGIWTESDSFDDTGFGPPPVMWKCICQTSNITCNKDKTGDFDMISRFLEKNWKIAKWVALGAVIFETLVFLVALLVKAANKPEGYLDMFVDNLLLLFFPFSFWVSRCCGMIELVEIEPIGGDNQPEETTSEQPLSISSQSRCSAFFSCIQLLQV
ncbi:hypothetical protein POM88_000460 [Heracleum sosnowskyi]|uniref:Inhibitor I9 domain-containing protein n=1 Tax=Heracleum sosnowskyi TaxID=360622 RepID=A0AAD8JED0_9APIA|nr:hypothetical protein POM88_000460 [Heracleum sosnowskyi]